MKGLNSRVFRAKFRCARLNVLRPVTCSMSNVSWIGRWIRCPCSLRASSFQYTKILFQHLNIILGSSRSIILRRRWYVEGYIAMTSQDSRWAAHSDGYVVVLTIVRISARRSNKIIFKNWHSMRHTSWIITSETRKRTILTTHVRTSNSPFRNSKKL